MVRIAKIAVEAAIQRTARGELGKNKSPDERDNAADQPAAQNDCRQMRSLRHDGGRSEYARTDDRADRDKRQIERIQPPQ